MLRYIPVHESISDIHINFNTKHSIDDLNNIYQFQGIQRKFPRAKERKARQTNRSYFSALLESVKNISFSEINASEMQSHLSFCH